MWTHRKGQKKGKEDKIAHGCCAYEPHRLTPHTCFFDIYLHWYSDGSEEDEMALEGSSMCAGLSS